jgi:hypothetical protein
MITALFNGISYFVAEVLNQAEGEWMFTDKLQG